MSGRMTRDELARRVAANLAVIPNPTLDAVVLAARLGELRRIGALMRLRIECDERGAPFPTDAETCSAEEFVARYVRQRTLRDLMGVSSRHRRAAA